MGSKSVARGWESQLQMNGKILEDFRKKGKCSESVGRGHQREKTLMQTHTAIKTNTIHNQSYDIYNKDKTSSKYLSIVISVSYYHCYYCLLSLYILTIKKWWERFSN